MSLVGGREPGAAVLTHKQKYAAERRLQDFRQVDQQDVPGTSGDNQFQGRDEPLIGKRTQTHGKQAFGGRVSAQSFQAGPVRHGGPGVRRVGRDGVCRQGGGCECRQRVKVAGKQPGLHQNPRRGEARGVGQPQPAGPPVEMGEVAGWRGALG